MISNPFSQSVAQAMQKPNVNMVLAAEFDFKSGYSRVHTGVGKSLLMGRSIPG